MNAYQDSRIDKSTAICKFAVYVTIPSTCVISRGQHLRLNNKFSVINNKKFNTEKSHFKVLCTTLT